MGRTTRAFTRNAHSTTSDAPVDKEALLGLRTDLPGALFIDEPSVWELRPVERT